MPRPSRCHWLLFTQGYPDPLVVNEARRGRSVVWVLSLYFPSAYAARFYLVSSGPGSPEDGVGVG